MAVSGEIDSSMARCGIGDGDELARPHELQLLGGGVASVVAHDPSDQPRGEQAIRPLHKGYGQTFLRRRQGRRTAGPAAADHNKVFALFIQCDGASRSPA